MPLRSAEAFILRTYPLKESDKIVSFFTREYGKRRGVARAARRPKSRFGAMLEPLSHVRVQYFEREGKDLANIDRCERLDVVLAGPSPSLLHSVAVSLMVEVADRILPDHEVNEPVFRLLLAVLPVLEQLRGEGAWAPLTYYLLWMVRLGGFLPRFEDDRLSPELLRVAPGAISEPVLAACAGPDGRLLRQRLKWCLEDHLEASLHSWPMVASLEPLNSAEPA